MRCWAAVVFLSLCGGCGSKAPATKSGTLFTGDYLRSDYLEILNRTRSPYLAGKPGGPQMITVARDGEGLKFTVDYNFHEGSDLVFLRADGSFGQTKQDRPVKAWRWLDDHHFVAEVDKEPPMEYVYVGDLDRYLSDSTIAGNYKDAQGNSYGLDSNGQGYFAGRRFRYAVGADHIFSAFDYFIEEATSPSAEAKLFGFKIAADVLEIYGTRGELSSEMDDKPMLRLRRIPATE